MTSTRAGVVAVGALSAVGLMMTSVPAPAAVHVPPAGVTGSLQVPQASAGKQTAKLHVPERLKTRGDTVLLRKPTFTNVGQRVRVSVATKSRHGQPTTKADLRVIRRHGRVTLALSGRTWVRATVTYRARSAPGFAAFSKTKVYKSWRTEKTKSGDPRTGANMVGVEWKDMLQGLLTSVASDVGGGAAGWAVGFLFSLADDPKPDPIGEIKKQLEQIAAQLDSINNKLDELARQNAFEACFIQTNLGTDAVATINTQAKQFRRYMNPANPNKDRKDWVKWANDVLDTRNGSLERLEYLRLQLINKGGTSGALKQCGDAFRMSWESGPALAEAQYYENMWIYLNFFYQAEILGLNNVVEAYHILAADAYKGSGPNPRPLPAPKDIKSICKNTTSGGKDGASPSQYCEYAAAEAKDLYYSMLSQAKAVGAAYAWNVDAQKAVAMQAKSSMLWVTDLNKYGNRSRCNGPVNSNGACGPTVGKTEALSVTSSLGYDRWEVARSETWRNLLGPTGRARNAGDAMAKAGFPSSMQHSIIIYTGESVDRNSTQMRWKQWWNATRFLPLAGDWGALCLLDTDLGASDDGRRTWVFCADDASFWYLADKIEDEGGCDETTYHYYPSDIAKNGSVSSFYQVNIAGRLLPNCQNSNDWYDEPSVVKPAGWMTRDANTGTPEFRWPVQDVSRRQCLSNLNWGEDRSAMQPRNASGAWTMCGEDFKAWLKTQLPDPPK